MYKQYYLYILASKRNGTLYIGVTSNLAKRVYEHKTDTIEGFTKDYSVHNLVCFEVYTNIEDAIKREKNMKKWKRYWKVKLINTKNPNWKDLYNEILK
jgi:putative endonuclease